MVETIIAFISNPKSPVFHARRNGHKSAGQAMVEFALALPILLMVVYGLLETGRLLFIYSSTVTAARQAARYGSATGSNASNIPYYRDCDGIDNAANRVGFLNTFMDINVTYDRGLDASGDVVAIPGIDADPAADTCPSMNDTTLQNGDRIKVQVITQWAPIISVSRLIPSFQPFTITSSAERTILMEVPIGVDPESEIWVPGGALQLTVTSSTPPFDQVGDVLEYTYSLYNNANFDLHGPISVTDNTATPYDCNSAPGTLTEGSTYVCHGRYTVTQADLDLGYVTNLVIARSLETTSNQTGVTILAIQNKVLTLTKTPSITIAMTEGIVVNYTYRLTNDGNVTLSSPFSVSDNKINSVDCSGTPATLAPGAQTQCTASYSITAADIADAAVINTATATAMFNSQPVTSNTAVAKVNTSPLDLTASTNPTQVNTLNQRIAYTYTLTNVGSVALSAPYSITDDRAINISCPSSSSLAPGGTTTCTGEYFVTQADLDSGGPLLNHAIGRSNGGAVRSNLETKSVAVEQLPSLSVTINPPTGFVASAGTVVTFQYVIRNNGNVTLSSPYDIVEQGMTETASCPSTAPLAPLATTTCTLSHTITAAEMTAGQMVSIANATAYHGADLVTSPQATVVVATYNAPRLTLEIASTPSSFSSAGTSLSIVFTLRNTGNTALSAPYSVSANAFLGTITCSGTPATLAIGATTTCSASYTTTAADQSAKSVTITGTATAMNGGTSLNSASTTLVIPTSFQCFVYHRLTTTTPPSITFPRVNQLQMSVINDSATSSAITIQSIKLSNWNFSSHAQQYITSISFGGVQIYTGSSANRVNPFSASAPFAGSVSLNPGQTKVLLFTFNKNYNETGNEKLEITFTEAGCPVLDSSNGTQVK